MWHKPCRTFHPWCLCIKTRCLYPADKPLSHDLFIKMNGSATWYQITTTEAHQNGNKSPLTKYFEIFHLLKGWIGMQQFRSHHLTCVQQCDRPLTVYKEYLGHWSCVYMNITVSSIWNDLVVGGNGRENGTILPSMMRTKIIKFFIETGLLWFYICGLAQAMTDVSLVG